MSLHLNKFAAATAVAAAFSLLAAPAAAVDLPRPVKAGIRASDSAPIAYIELVDRDVGAKGQDSGSVEDADELEAA